MSKLTKGQRANLKPSQFAGPGRTFPVNNATHARAAEMDAPAAVRAGSISRATEKRIDAKARAVLKGKGK